MSNSGIIKKHYEEYWQDKVEEFEQYVRNKMLLKLFSKGEKVLDLGCGDGAVGEALQKKLGVEVVGMDISKSALEIARKRGIKTVLGNSEDKLPFKDQTFDAVFWGDNVEHLFSPIETAREVKRILKTNGRLVISCPNMGYWRYRLYYFLKGSLPDTEWTDHKSWDWSHIRFFNFSLMAEFLKTAGFSYITQKTGVSERKLDKLLLPFSHSLFGMILIMEAK